MAIIEEINSFLSNYYGNVCASWEDEGYFMTLEEYGGIEKVRISEEFYLAFKKEFGSKEGGE